MAATAPGPAAEARVLSHYQARIIQFVVDGRGHGVVQATAGAGKTSTLVEVARHLDRRLRACFLAFGRDAAAELRRRLPSSVSAMTVHRLGRQTLQQGLRRRGVPLQRVERGKYRRLLRGAVSELRLQFGLAESRLTECEVYLSALLDLARLSFCDLADDEALRELVLRHTIVPPDGEVESLAHRALRLIVQQGTQEALELGSCDFTDMLYLPVTQGLEPQRFDFVCVDEAQDYSPLALEFTRLLVDEAAGGRLLFVGDPRQSIYGFAGADSGAMERITGETAARVLPLSISYRCPRSHVTLARLLAPEIEAGPEAQEGRVFWIGDAVLAHWAREGDMILCRANAPLVKTCLKLVRAGRRASIRGRDLRRQLLELSERVFSGAGGSSMDLATRLEEFGAREAEQLTRVQGDRHQVAALAEARRDLLECLRFLASVPGPGLVGLTTLQERIDRAFGEREQTIVLSTIHRAKGLEADRILLLYPELMPAPYARTSQALHGEAAVQFVALTRARRDLVFVSEGRSRPLSSSFTATTPEPQGLAPDDRVGQGPGVWREVLELAWLLARRRG